MGFDVYGCRLLRKKAEAGKICVILTDDDTLARQLTEDRTSLRGVTRVNVAFFTSAEYRQWYDEARRARAPIGAPTMPVADNGEYEKEDLT